MQIDEVALYFPIPHYVSGPAKVATNLLMGLRRLGISVRVNQSSKYCACLNSLAPNFENLPIECLMGPNLVYKPDDMPWLFEKHVHFVVPSQAIRDAYLESEIVRGCNFYVWTSGIDTERFSPKQPSSQNYPGSTQLEPRDCIVYFKNRKRVELEQLMAQLEKRKITYYLAEYEKYQEIDFLNWARQVKYCILVNGVESQGIALMELWSCGVPSFALIPPGLEPVIRAHATEEYPLAGFLPYFKPSCGMFGATIEGGEFDQFLSRVHEFKPREYIVKDHGIEVAARKYLDLLQKTHLN